MVRFMGLYGTGTDFNFQDALSNDVEAIFNELEDNPEDSGPLAGVKAHDAALLARLIQERIIYNPDRTGQEMEQELTVDEYH
jgi:hypothetical protein